VDEVVRNQVKLKTFANDFFNKLSQDIEENNGSERLGGVIGLFVGLGNDDH